MARLAVLPDKSWFNALFLAAVLGGVGYAYAPSLEHVPRADQWAYLIDTADCRTFGELLAKSYSYNRIRAVGPGDADLFRPVLFALLVVQKHCFGNNFVPSQVIGLALHATIVWLLFVLLRRIERLGEGASEFLRIPLREDGPRHLVAELARVPPWFGFLPHALTVFFALNFASMELVVWAHLHGYLLFLALVLGALILLWDVIYRTDLSARRRRWTLVGCWALILVAAFTYELGQFFAVIVGLVLAMHGWRRHTSRVQTLLVAGSFLAILPLYQAVNRLDRVYHRERFAEEYLPELIGERAVSLMTLEHTGRFFAYTLVQPFFPSVTGWWYQGERIHIREPVHHWPKYVEPNLKLLLSYGSAALFFGFGVAAARRFYRGGERCAWPMIAMPLGLLALYTGITVLGRMNLRPSDYVLASNSYYAYVALLLLVVGMFALWQALPRQRAWQRGAGLLCAGLVFLGCYSSGRIRHVSQRLTDRYAGFHAVVRQLEAFLDEQGRDPDLKLAFDMRPSDPFPVTHSIPFPLVLYPEWIDNHTPRYVVSFPEGGFAVTPADEWRRRHGTLASSATSSATGEQLFPDLVEVGTNFNLWRWQGRYYATLYWDDVFRPDVKDHAYVIEGETIREVLDLVPVRFEEFLEDLRMGWCIPPRLGTETFDADYHGFMLTQAGDYYYATPAAEGPFNVDRFNARRYSAIFVAEDEDMLRRFVDEHHAVVK